MFQMFDRLSNVNLQVQKKKRRRNKKQEEEQHNWGQQNQGWGQQNQGNNGWGNQNQGQGNNGWGNQGQGNNGWGQQNQGNNGWGNQNQGQGNNGWGQQNQSQGNNGWGQQGNNGWGNQGGNNGGNQGNNGWGNQGGNNDGWGNQGQGNNGWGQQNQGNNGWGNQGGNSQNNSGFQNALFGNQQIWGNNLSGSQWVEEQIKRNTFNIIQSGQQNQMNFSDIKNIIEKQVIFLEPSPTQKKLQQLQKEGKCFYDDRFPPNLTSLTGQWGKVHEWSQIQWKKVSQVMPKAKIFQGKCEPGDIKQGYLGDCYFLAGLAALAERPDRIFSLFLLQEVNQVKYYSVKMIYKGKWMTIDMDQYIPYLYNSPAFTKAKDDQLWVVLLEKAWAKLYTSYKRIEAGYPEEALHDLTGAPVRNLYLKQASFNKEKEWEYLLKASHLEYSMVASSRPGSDSDKSQTGIVQGHAYTFLNATYLHFQGGKERVVQLRNPWGKGESKGRWSDKDPNWNYISAEEKKRIGYKNDSNDGTFFMTYDDFLSEFRALAVAEVNDNASYIYKSVKDPECKGVYFKIQIAQKGSYSLQVDKTPERIYPQKTQDLYRYPEARIELRKIENGQCTEKLQTTVSARRTLYHSYDLTPGVYVAMVKISYDRKFEKDFDVNLAIYAEYFCDIDIATHNEAVAFSGNPNVDWTGKIEQESKPWNHMGNTQYQNSGWGNQGNQGNSGWGNQGNQGNQGNNGWGNQGNQGNQGNNGWGNQGNQGNNGWGNQGNQGNNGWGNQGTNNDGWGNQGNQGKNDGWGNQNQSNDGWGQQNKNQNQGWGNQPPQNQNQNKGWGPGW